MGCYAPSIKNVSITGFGGDGIRVNGDLSIDSNPDFTATIFLSVEGCMIPVAIRPKLGLRRGHRR